MLLELVLLLVVLLLVAAELLWLVVAEELLVVLAELAVVVEVVDFLWLVEAACFFDDALLDDLWELLAFLEDELDELAATFSVF